jgi:hypothetical protein
MELAPHGEHITLTDNAPSPPHPCVRDVSRGGGGSMDNPALPQAKSRLKRPRKPGDLAAVQRKVWWALLRAEEVLDTAGVPTEQRLRAVHAISQTAATYANLLKTSDLEARIAALEQALQQRRHSRGAA